jgi:hypothetical protein
MRKTLLMGLLAVCTVAVSGCSSKAESPVSASAVSAGSSALNPDGSSLKVTAPSGLSPSGGATVDTLKPTLAFANAAGKYTAIGLGYEVEIQSSNGTVVYSRIIAQGANTTSHAVESDLEYESNYQWRSRGRLAADTGPWSALASFRTLNRPVAVVPPQGGLPFAIPAECGPGDPGNRFACVAAVAALSAEWRRCAVGIGIGCHRFARQVVYALSRSDPNYRMIVASPGGHACNCNACGPSDGTMFREDTTAYGGNRVFDMIVGAGGSSPSFNWSAVPGPRAGDIPADAPLCVP